MAACLYIYWYFAFALPNAKGEGRVNCLHIYDALRAYGSEGIAPFILNALTKCS